LIAAEPVFYFGEQFSDLAGDAFRAPIRMPTAVARSSHLTMLMKRTEPSSTFSFTDTAPVEGGLYGAPPEEGALGEPYN